MQDCDHQTGKTSAPSSPPDVSMIGLAEALYDNESEWPDELAFLRGDMLRVLDQNPAPQGLADGWWLCSDQTGQQGIAPANRLRLLTHLHFPQNRPVTPTRQIDRTFLSGFGGEVGSFPTSDNPFLSYDVPPGLRNLRLFHDWEHPLKVNEDNSKFNNHQPVVHNIPIRLENGDQPESSVPPRPPERKHFHNFDAARDFSKSSGSNEMEDLRTKRSCSLENRKWPSECHAKEAPKRNGHVRWSSPEKLPSSTSLSRERFEKNGTGLNTGSLGNGILRNGSKTPFTMPRSSNMVNSFNSALFNKPTMYASTSKFSTMNNSDSKPPLPFGGPSVFSRPSGMAKKVSWDSSSNDSGIVQKDFEKIPSKFPLPDPLTVSADPGPNPPSSGSSGFVSEHLPSDTERLSVSSVDSSLSDYQGLLEVGRRPLPLTPGAALNVLANRQQDVQSAVAELCGYSANRNWRKRHILQANLSQIRDAVGRICQALDAFLDFSSAAMANLSRKAVLENDQLPKKLAHVIRPLRDSQGTLDSLRKSLGNMGWTLSSLSREASYMMKNDALDQFLAVARALPQDCRQVCAFVQGNASLIFGVSTDSDNPVKENGAAHVDGLAGGRVIEEHELDSVVSSDCESLFGDYDFPDGLPPLETDSSRTREDSATPTAESTENETPNLEDATILRFYAPQVDSHMEYLGVAIDDFLSCVEESRPPQIFVGRSKLVILAAHKLVYIGDSIGQCLRSSVSRDQIKKDSDRLCQVLKDCVSAVKAAAAQYPTVASIQAMVNNMVNVSHAAHDLKLLIRHLAN